MIRLINIDEIRPSSYNPRLSDPARLDIIELSLRKLGFLIPAYADADGEILSGHQRHFVATRIGCKKMPVEFTKRMDLAERKATNIVFNRATNDMDLTSTPKSLNEALEKANLDELASGMPDIEIDSEDFFPCMKIQDYPIADLLKRNSGKWEPYANRISRTLFQKKILMPIILAPDLSVVNGIGRLEMLAEKKRETAPVLFIDESRVELARVMLNLLSMDFDIHNRYEDLMRHNSFRRARRVRSTLGRGFIFAVFGGKTTKEVDLRNRTEKIKWIREHGTSVLDFGAGHLHETDILREVGIDVTPFEPYRLGEKNSIDKKDSIELAKGFLDAVRSGKVWSSIFISSVLNSVPFKKDREHIITLCSALCSPRTKVYAAASAITHRNWQQMMGKKAVNKRNISEINFKLEYETGIHLGDLGDAPKMQKYHTTTEFHDLFGVGFKQVDVKYCKANVEAIAKDPLTVNPERLREAIEFEFNLPYPDGSRMGLVDEAIEAFNTRLGGML